MLQVLGSRIKVLLAEPSRNTEKDAEEPVEVIRIDTTRSIRQIEICHTGDRYNEGGGTGLYRSIRLYDGERRLIAASARQPEFLPSYCRKVWEPSRCVTE